MKNLQLPLTEESVRSLRIGDSVTLTGTIYTARDAAHKYLAEAKECVGVPDIRGAVLYHCGPIMTEIDGKKTVVAAGPTTSARMNSLESEMISRFHIRAIVGKGGMSKEVAETMAEEGCVYLAATGGAAVTLAEGLARIEGVEWLDLGMPEAIWKFRASRLGPLIVAMDCEGNSLYEQVRNSIKR